MPTITKDKAVELLTDAIPKAHSYDLVEYYNELFPENPMTEEEAKKDLPALVDQVVSYIKKGLEIEELLDLWNVVFPGYYGVCFDEEEGLLYFDEGRQPVSLPD